MQTRPRILTSFMTLVIVGHILLLGQTSAEDAFPLRAKRILFLGDSITNAGHYIADIETQLLLRKTNGASIPELLNLGLPSETCSGYSEPDHPFPRPDVHERLDRALAKVKPDVVVACYGMNDGIYYPFSQARFEGFQAGINKLIDKVHAAEAKLVLLTPPPFDPVPLQGKPGKLLPLGAEKYAWFAIYEDYNQHVMRPYADWIRTLSKRVEMVVNTYTPMTEFLAEQRRDSPDFFVAADGVHMDAVGHEVLAKAILKAWGIADWQDAPVELRTLVKQKESVLHNAWLSHVGHKRPGVTAGLSIPEATKKAAAFEKQIEDLAATAQTAAGK